MVEERTLALERANTSPAELNKSDEDVSKDDLQQRMEAARESISNTVDVIKDTVMNQYESVKETVSQTLDWHEQVRKRPVAWSAGAVGAGFIVGYGVAAVIKGPTKISVPSYEKRTMARAVAAVQSNTGGERSPAQGESGPGLIQRITETPAFGRVKSEAGIVGNHFVDELSKKAKEVVVPAAMAWIGRWLAGLAPDKANEKNTGH